MVLRTFSKAWGLAGLRLGWLCAQPSLVAGLEKVRLPYNIDALTQALACEALDLADAFPGRGCRGCLGPCGGALEAALKAVPGAEVWPSDTHFVLVRHPRAEALHAALLAKGLRTRRFEGARLRGPVPARINAGDEAQHRARLELALKAPAQGAVTA